MSRSSRDAGLRKVTAITRWTLAGALAGTGFFAGLASSSGRGAAGAKAPATSAGAASTSQSSSQSSDAQSTNGDDNGYTQLTPATAPPVVPAQSGSSAPIVSGAS